MNLEDKILGEKLNYYCSSSEDEKEDSGDEGDEEGKNNGKAQAAESKLELAPDTAHFSNSGSGGSSNTGPKGVIKDWQRFKQLETEKKQDQERERLELLKKLSITSKTTSEDQKAQEREEFDKELEELLDDDFLIQFQKKRMLEMLEMSGMVRKFGELISLNNKDEFLQAIDSEHKNVTVIVHVYEEKNRACKAMNTCLIQLAEEYACVKFCKILSTIAGLSKNFRTSALPTILVYKNGNVIGNFIRLHDEFGDEFISSDVEGFLIEHSLLPDKTLLSINTSINSSAN